MTKTLYDRMAEINKNDPVSVDYENRRAAAKKEIEAILEPVYEQVRKVLTRYDMDLTDKLFGRGEKAKSIIRFYDSEINNAELQNQILQASRRRSSAVDQAMKNIEPECTLGADRDAFMKMLDEVVIE